MNNTSIKSALSLAIVSVVAMMSFTSCEYNDIPSGPKDAPYVYDTVDFSRSRVKVPAGAITVRKAIEIGEALGSGGTSSEAYYIKGLVKSFNTSKNADGIKNYGNAFFYICDNSSTGIEFYAYQTYGFKGSKLTSENQVQKGDTVVIYCYITNFNGTIECKTGKDVLITPQIYSSSNDLLYPMGLVDWYKEKFDVSLGEWVASNPMVWTWSSNPQCAQAKSVEEGLSRLVSPSIDLTTASSPKLYFSHFHKGTNEGDKMEVQISTDGGSRWTTKFTNERSASARPLFANDSIDLADCVGSQVKIALVYTVASVSEHTWNVNNVHVSEWGRVRD